jgi:hypothetical protein
MAKNIRRLAAVAAAAVAAAAALATGAGAAQAAASSAGWRLTAVYPEDSGVDGVYAASANNAWAVEQCTRPCHTGDGGTTLRHWNGSQWQVISARPAHASGALGSLLGIAPGAKSTPWVLYSYKSYTQPAVARWTGKSWSAPTLLAKNTNITQSVVAGPSSVWVFGFNTKTDKPYTARYNGRTWSAAPSSGLFPESVSAVSPTDIWVTGVKLNAAKGSWPMAVSHWNGTKWTISVLPRVAVPAKSNGYPLSIVADGAANVWALGYITGPDGSIVPNDGMILDHWNGARWSRVTLPYKETQVFQIFPDGRGGIWLWDEVDPGHHDYLIHDSNGHWSRDTMPRPANAFSASVGSITPIPGTSSLWAGGAASVPIPVGGNPGGTEGLILRYTA